MPRFFPADVRGVLPQRPPQQADAATVCSVDVRALASRPMLPPNFVGAALALHQADLRLLVAALEVERADIGARIDLAPAHFHDVEPAGDLLPHGLLRIERIAALVDVGELDGLTEADRTGVGLLLAGDHLE